MVYKLFINILALSIISSIYAAPVRKPGADVLEQRAAKKQKPDDLISFSFEKKSLIEIIEQLAAEKKINIILPQQAVDLEALKKQTISYQPQGKEKISLTHAWNILYTFLELSGFALSERKDGLFTISRVGRPDEPGINREILPLFVNTPPDKLPDTEERIRYMYYLRNLMVPTLQDRDTNPIARIFKDMLSNGAPVIFEAKANGFIITDKANVIASVMRIITELDHSGFKETIQVIELHNVPARDVVKVFDSLKKASGDAAQPSPFIRGDARVESLSYFAADTKIIADDRNNSLIVMGRESAVERIAEFIEQYMDTAPETGKSILHYYDLQYLDAKLFADVLTRIVLPPATAGFQASAGPAFGPERYFQGVVVMAEEVKTVETKSTTEEITLEAKGGYLPVGLGNQQIITGGNRLIVAAIQDDWLRLRDFIEALDKPQPQVILEVLIVDIVRTKQKIVSSTIRTKTDSQLPNGTQFLSSNISNVNSVLGSTPSAINVDLLALLSGPLQQPSNPAVTSLLQPGSLLISFNDPLTPGIFGLLQVLDRTLDSKVLSHPFLVTTNNQKATIASQTLKRVQGDAVPGAAGVITIEIVDVPATIQVQMIPRLSSLERLQLQVAVDVNQFIDPTSFTRETRRVNTNANMASGQILVIGGLTRTDQIDIETGTPFLSRIPLIGTLFSGKNKTVTKTNIAIFISPTIVQPKLRGGLNVYTADKIRKCRRDVDEQAIFNEMRDPITRIFFNVDGRSDKLLRDYLSAVDNPPDAAQIQTSFERRQLARRVRKPAPQKAPNAPARPVSGPVRPIPA